jgi:hypothetical protein
VLAYRALEARDEEALRELLDEHPELVRQRGTNGNDLLGLAGVHRRSSDCCSSAGRT